MIVANFTPDIVEWQHVGITGTLLPNDVVDLPEGRANHILNKFGRRGVIVMNFGDKEEESREKAMELWRDFWEYQITQFNQHNENQKEKGNRYERPTKEILDHAEILGLELLSPWIVKKDSGSGSGGNNTEVEAMKQQMGMLSSTVSALTDLVQSLVGDKTKTHDFDFTTLPAKDFRKYIIENKDSIKGMPDTDKAKMLRHWAEVEPDKTFPIKI
jgi:hypothetical protein